MPEEIIPSRVQTTVRRGFERMQQYRRARAMFVKEFVGQYYQGKRGLTGNEPINLIFHTIRTMVPNLVMQSPITDVVTDFAPQKFYGELLGLAVDKTNRDIKLKQTLRAWIVAAIFAMGILKTGIAASGETLQFGDTRVDPGRVYTSLVDLDDFVFDPVCTDLEKSTFLGDRIRVPRQLLLDTEGYDHDLVAKLPRSRYNVDRKVEDLTKKNIAQMEMYTLQDFVDVVELWVPEANAIVTIPDPAQITFDKYIRIKDYYGPKEGPYTFLSFTPPVPNNPLPVASVSLWYDLHRMANRIFKKTMDQADRQKDVMVFNPAQADEAQDILEAQDGDSVASQDPKGIQVVSFGGQNRSNELMLQELQMWYNYISGNPDQMAGNMPRAAKGKETATRSSILQSNANVSIEDARGILYDQTAEVNRKEAWFLHTDPLIDIPLTKRSSDGEQIQLRLTPEQRVGDFLKFTFRIIARSMSRLDPTIKSKRVIEFGVNLLPAIMNSAMIALQMGMRFNPKKALTDIANEQGILEQVQDWFDDPEFERKMAMVMAKGPQNAGKAGMITSGAIAQNDGFPETRNVLTPGQEFNQNAQMGAAEDQSARIDFTGMGL